MFNRANLIRKAGFFRQSSSNTQKSAGVIVRVWRPGEGSVGHVSLETKKNYISLWPIEGISKPGIKWETSDGTLVPTFDQDQKANGMLSVDPNSGRTIIIPKKPEVTLNFHTLNEEIINKKFDDFKNSKLKWALIGNNEVFLKKDVHSCASLVYHLLDVAGLNNLFEHETAENIEIDKTIYVDKIIQTNLVVTPNNIESVLTHAKKN